MTQVERLVFSVRQSAFLKLNSDKPEANKIDKEEVTNG